jgi:voltage-gated potassium channel Kch
MTAENPRRHLFLLIALLFIFILSPFVLPFYYGPTIMNVVGAVVLLSATYAVSGRRLFLIIAVTLSTLSIFMTFWLAAAPTHGMTIAAHTSAFLLIGFFAVAILISVLRSGRVTADKIYGAICAYLLLGYAWAFAYSVIEEIQPGSFATQGPAANDIVSRVMQMRYFSFVTLATVGYGDIVPRMPLARTVALLEAMVGQFYLVALIGRLVGLHIVHGNPERSGQRSD